MSYEFVAFLRGINVGRAKRVRMEDLREVFTSFGYTSVRTILNSGNVLFTAKRPLTSSDRRSIEEAIARRTRVDSRVMLLSTQNIRDAIRDCPLLAVAHDPTRLLIAIPYSPRNLIGLKKLLSATWQPDALAVGAHVAYLWCPGGIADSRLLKEVNGQLGQEITVRNWNTLQRLAPA